MTDNLRVPLLDLKAQYTSIKPELDAAIERVMQSCQFIGGPEVSALESEIARYSGVRHAVACASGTDALLLSLRGLGLQSGDEVVTTAFSFFATAGTITNNGARVRFVDIDPQTYNIDIPALEAAIGERTKAVVAVSLFGQCPDLPRIAEICSRRGVDLIEDAAQSIGSHWDGRRSGSMSRLGCFSFFPSKNLGAAGDGGMIVTDDAELADRIRVLCNHGGRPKYYHQVVGTNSRLDAMQAAILRVKLPYLDAWSQKRADNARIYDELLAGYAVETPFRSPRSGHIYNQYIIRTPRRDALREHLTRHGVGTEIYYPLPLHLQECYSDLGYRPGDMPHAEAAARETLAIPIYPELTQAQLEYVANCVREFAGPSAGRSR